MPLSPYFRFILPIAGLALCCLSAAAQPAEDARWAVQIETDLQIHPENLREREELMAFYDNQGQHAAFTKHMLWVIGHHPDAPAAGMRYYPRPGEPATMPEESTSLDGAWEAALASHPGLASVLYHAGLYWEQEDAARALDLFRQALENSASDSDSEGYRSAIAYIYSSAVMFEVIPKNLRLQGLAMNADLVSELSAELDRSSDPAFLARVGAALVRQLDNGHAGVGLALIEKAVRLDPANPQWREVLDAAKAEPVRQENYAELRAAARVQ